MSFHIVTHKSDSPATLHKTVLLKAVKKRVTSDRKRDGDVEGENERERDTGTRKKTKCSYFNYVEMNPQPMYALVRFIILHMFIHANSQMESCLARGFDNTCSLAKFYLGTFKLHRSYAIHSMHTVHLNDFGLFPINYKISQQ